MIHLFNSLDIVILSALVGGFLYRWRGGGFFWAPPRPIPQYLFTSMPALFVPCLILRPGDYAGGAVVILANLLSVGGCLIGHGNFQDLGTWTGISHPPNVIERLFTRLRPRLTPYWYDALGLALVGSTMTLAPGAFVAAYGHPLAGALLALSGALQAPAYMIGRAVNKSAPTEAGEKLTGFFIWTASALIWEIFFHGGFR